MVAPSPNNRISPSGPLANVKETVSFEQEIADNSIAAGVSIFYNMAIEDAVEGQPAAFSLNSSLPSGLLMSAPTVLSGTVGFTIYNFSGGPISTGDIVASWLLFNL